MTKARKRRRNPIMVIIIVALVLLALAAGLLFAFERYLVSTHPIKYQNYVEQYSNEFDVDSFLVYAVIKTESGYRPDAVSNGGARGLMQITEETFDWIKFKLGDEETTFYDMFDPQTNIRYGCFLLGYLTEEFGNIEATMAAYHAGRGSVNSWLQDKRYSDDGVHLKEIPISDTAYYVEKINRAIIVYHRLYDKAALYC